MKYLKTLERFSNLVEKKNAELKSIYKSLLKEAKEAGIEEDEVKEAETDDVKEADQSFAEDEISAADFFKECDEKVEECDEKTVEEADDSDDKVDEAEDNITAEEFFSDSEDTEKVDEADEDEKDVDEAEEKVDEDDILKGRNHNGHLKEAAKKEAPKKAKKLAETEDDKAVEEDEKDAEATDEAEEWMNADEFFAPLKNEKEDAKAAAEDVDEEENVEEDDEDDITEADFFEEDDAEEEVKEDDNEEVNEDDFGKGRIDLTAAVDSGKVKPRFNNHDLSTIKGTIASCLKKHVAEFTPEVMQNPDHAVEVIKGWFDEDGIDTPDSRKYLALIGNKDPRSKFRGPNNKKNVDNIIRYLTNIYLKGAGCGLGNRFHETEEVEEDDKQVAESLKMYRNMNKRLFEC